MTAPVLDALATRLGLIVVCGYGAFAIRHQTLLMPEPYWHTLLATLALFGLSELLLPSPKGWQPVRRGVDAGLRVGLIALILSATAFALKISDQYSRLWAIYWALSSWGALLGLALAGTPHAQSRRRLILVGEPEVTGQVQADYAPHSGPDIVCLRPPELLDWLDQRDATGTPLDGEEILLVGHVPEPAQRTALVLALHGSPVALRYCPDLNDFLAGGERGTLPLVPAPGAVQDMIKRVEDVLFASVTLALCAPLMAVIALLVWRSGPGPILFHQRRLGLGGRAFTIYKFRTMVPTASDQAEAPQAEGNDSRVTGIGRILRHWGLDELPQLLNVLRGEMSLVGPRPHAFPHDMAWGSKLPQYAQRFRMRPGITGLAQIRGWRGHVESDIAITTRLDLDLQYIRTWSLGQDLRILAETIPSLIRNAPPSASPPGQPPHDPLGQHRD
jgi:putative colanic acid biosysnthesis UDP-glucose lipid carrier transferase